MTHEQTDLRREGDNLFLHCTGMVHDLEGRNEERYHKSLYEELAYLERQRAGTP